MPFGISMFKYMGLGLNNSSIKLSNVLFVPSQGPHIKTERKKDFIFHMRILNEIYIWKEKYPAYAHVEDPL